MARRRASRAKGDTTGSAAEGDSRAPRGALAAGREDGRDEEAEPTRSVIDLLRPRAVIIAFVAIEIVAVILLLPRYHYHQLNNAVEKAVEAGDYGRAYDNLGKISRRFGIEPERAPKKWWGGWINLLLHRNKNHRQRHYYKGAEYLIELGRYEEAGALLDGMNLKAVKSKRFRARAWKPNMMRGAAAYETGQTNKALGFFLKSLAKNPEDQVSSFYVGRDLYQKGRYLEASLYLTRCRNHEKYGAEAKQLLTDIGRLALESDADAKGLETSSMQNGPLPKRPS